MAMQNMQSAVTSTKSVGRVTFCKIQENHWCAREILTLRGTHDSQEPGIPQNETLHSLIVRSNHRRSAPAWETLLRVYQSFLYRMAERRRVPPRHVPDTVSQLSPAGDISSLAVDSLSTDRYQIHDSRATPDRSSGWHASDGSFDAVPEETDQQQRASCDHELIVWSAEQIKKGIYRHQLGRVSDNRVLSSITGLTRQLCSRASV